MAERPILFSGEMVRAILAGTKTQTRRPVKPQDAIHGPCEDGRLYWIPPTMHGEADPNCLPVLAASCCPIAKPGDLLWVRETWAAHWMYDDLRPSEARSRWPDDTRWYRADGEGKGPTGTRGIWRPSIHMPRWAARIWLRVTDVRVERVQSITEDDARAEGVEARSVACAAVCGWPDPPASYRHGFLVEWGDIYGDESIDHNDWVWAISFERCEAPAREDNHA